MPSNIFQSSSWDRERSSYKNPVLSLLTVVARFTTCLSQFHKDRYSSPVFSFLRKWPDSLRVL